jgi:hypothetical protein
MKTDDLISMLATGVAPVERHVAAKRFGVALMFGAMGALAIVIFGYGVRHDIDILLHAPLFWAKLAWPTCLAVAALAAAVRLGRPGRVVGGWVGRTRDAGGTRVACRATVALVCAARHA